MARINISDSLDTDVDYGDFDYQSRKRKRRRKRRRIGFRGGCCLVFLFLVLSFAIVAAAALAKSGLVEIPLFSRIFYQLPVPIRQVEADTSGVSFGVQNARLDQQRGLILFEVTESQLTYILRQYLSSEKNSYFASSVQVAVSDKYLEFFGLLLRPISANISFQLMPEVVDGRLDFAMTSFKIGDLPVPESLANLLLQRLVLEKLRQADDFDFTIIKAIDLEQGKMIIGVNLETEAIQNALGDQF